VSGRLLAARERALEERLAGPVSGLDGRDQQVERNPTGTSFREQPLARDDEVEEPEHGRELAPCLQRTGDSHAVPSPYESWPLDQVVPLHMPIARRTSGRHDRDVEHLLRLQRLGQPDAVQDRGRRVTEERRRVHLRLIGERELLDRRGLFERAHSREGTLEPA
jgi:hypothetical protein